MTAPFAFKTMSSRVLRSKRAALFCAFSSMLALSACQHRTVNQTVTDWTHGLMGGEVYKLRPPPPGYDKPFPNINVPPKYEPSFPSQEARAALTENLQEHRNYAQRLSAATGPLPTGPIAPPPPPGNGENSATLSSTDSKGSSAPGRTTEKPRNTPVPRTSLQSASPFIPSDMPKLKYQPIAHEAPHDLPAIGSPPPLPIGFGGFRIPPSSETIRPDFDAREPAGTLIRFDNTTDQLISGQEGTLQHVADSALHAQIVITGFGTSLSTDAGLKPADQQQEITLGLLRAKAVANELVKRAIPSERIILQARPIGDGVRIQIQPLRAYERADSLKDQ